MTRILEALPGLPMSVSDVTHTVRHMWDAASADGAPPISDFRASQMNLVLHFGTGTSLEEASRIFDTSIEFAQRYPCRVIVLAPRDDADGNEAEPLEAKLFSQCYVGPNLRELCCCEALMLSYPLNTSELIDHAVSLWLETDLPVYHWFHRVPTSRIEQYYHAFLARSRRVLFDRDVEGDVYDALTLPDAARLVDLAQARTLPIRQNLGQFLSNFRPASLVDGLLKVTVAAAADYRGEAHNLARWLHTALAGCARRAGSGEVNVDFAVEALAADSTNTLELSWSYRQPTRFLQWEHNARAQTGRLACDFGIGRFEHPLHIEPLKPSQSLAEALFF